MAKMKKGNRSASDTLDALSTAEDRFARSTRFANIGVWDWNVVTNVLFWSDQIWPMFGHAVGEVETSYDNFLEGVHPEDRMLVVDAINACLGKGVAYNIEHRVVWPDGTVRWMQGSGDAVRDEEGNPLKMLGVLRDITPQKDAEYQLRESEARFKGIAESMSDWIWEVDANGVYTFCSGRVGDILGYSPDEIIGRTPFDFMEADEAKKIADIFIGIIGEKAHIKDLENWNVSKDGRRVCLLTNGMPLFDNDGELIGYRGVDTDITERKLSEEHLIQAKQEAESANKAKSEFLSRMSHELRTPMNAILGFTELMLELDDDPLTDGQRVSLGTIHEAGHHLLDLINEVLDLSIIEAGEMKLSHSEVDWRNTVKLCSGLTLPTAKKQGLNIVEEISDEGFVKVRVDEVRFKQVLLNLLSNAVKYNCPEGTVILRANIVDTGQLRVEISDTGEGLTEDQIESLFQPFNRLQRDNLAREGVGIGLVISKHLIELMGGKIGVESVLGKGTTFWVELPTISG